MIDKKLIGKYKAYLKDNLSKKRYTHSVNVANAALELARRYDSDEDKAYIADLCHRSAPSPSFSCIIEQIVCNVNF